VQHLNGPPFHWTIKLITFFFWALANANCRRQTMDGAADVIGRHLVSRKNMKITFGRLQPTITCVKRSKSSTCLVIGRHFQMNENIFKKKSLKIAKN
jgi:hypothetical protein